MRILMLPCHEVLERVELSLLRSLGHYVFSPGSFVNPDNRGDHLLRPGLPGLAYDPADVDGWHALGRDGIDNKRLLTREYVDRFDLVIVHHIPEWISENWDRGAFLARPVVLRTIGQLVAPQEQRLSPYRANGMKIVRYSPAERRIPGYMGEDAMIRFAADPEEWHGWTGTDRRVLHVGQDVIKRAEACNWPFFEEITRPFPRVLLGNGSEAVDFGRGRVSYEDLKLAYRVARCVFYTGTQPASYTLGFIEAMMTGCPIVAIGPNHGDNLKHWPGHHLYEVHEILSETGGGIASDDPFELREAISRLLTDQDFATAMSERARAGAVRLFGVDGIREQWKAFLGTVS